MDAELNRRWTDETVPALLKWWPEYFSILENFGELNEDVLVLRKGHRKDGELATLRPDSLDSLHRISELLGVVTDAASAFMVDGRIEWCGSYSTGSFIYEMTAGFPTELDARLAAVIECVAELVWEKEAGNADEC